jgi:6-pyruvoyltetrahydropterin/6-carboxytetrahydropterin synthase
MIRLTRQYKFAASHRLHSPLLSEPENQRTYGKCANPYGHGHDYVLQVVTRGPVDPRTGLLVNLDQLDGIVDRAILRDVRNRNLNDLEDFTTLVPTTENLTLVAENRLRRQWPDAFPAGNVDLVGVRILETARNSFESPRVRTQRT